MELKSRNVLSTFLLSILLICVPLSVRAQERFSCTFESSTCSMNQDNDDDFDWERGESTTQTPGTGPDGGADGSRFYLFVETSNPRQPGDQARITTDRLDYIGDVCVSFSYHMFGSDMGELYVYLQNGDEFAGSNTNLFREEGDQGDSWLTKSIDVRLTNRDERVGWQATRGSDFESDIAIDTITITQGRCENTQVVDLTFRCDFETNFCSIGQRTDDDFDWTRQTGRTPSANTGPTSAASGSYYIFIETSDPADDNDEAIIETPEVNYRGDACVEFQYHMYGININKLVVYTSDRGRGNPWREYEGEVGDRWVKASIDIELDNDKVGFIGVRGEDLRGDIAIDDLVIREGVCNEETPSTTPSPNSGEERDLPWSCSFDSADLCDMFQNTDDQFDYLRQQGSTDTTNTGPSNGRTGSSTDYYIFAETSSPRVDGDQTIIETPAFDYSGTVCVSFYYHMNGADTGRLLVYQTSRGMTDPLVEYDGTQGDEWKFKSVTTSIGEGERIMFLSEVGDGIRGDIGLDDIGVKTGSCDGDEDGVRLPWTCSFANTDLCNMVQQSNDDEDDFSYLRQQGSTTTVNTGPSNGRGGSSDYYIYAEASSKDEGDRAIIETPSIDANGDICVKFYYHMYGDQMGKLVIYKSSQDGPENNLAEIEGNQGNSWQQRSVSANINSGEKILFLSEIGNGARSDIAIDDIDITAGDCEEEREPLPWSCSFSSSDLCEMTQLDDDDFDYIRQQRSTTTSNTGPSNGRTGSSSDYYIYAEASGKAEGDEALIETPALDYDGNICVQFYYHMYGSDMGRLRVYRSSQESNNQLVEIEDDQGNSWKQRSIETQISRGEKIMFSSSMGDGTRSDIALDDINISTGDCDDGGGSGSDQDLPWTCSFGNSDLCDMVQDDDDDFNFIRQSGRTSTTNTGPSNGRTGSSSDNYIYAEASSPQSPGDKAIIETPGFDDSGDICVEFYYHMFGSEQGKLVVYRSSRNENDALVTIENNQGDAWLKRSINANINRGEKIVFMAEIGDGIRSDIALDDIDVRKGACDGGGSGENLPWTCGFDSSNLCDMTQDDDDDFNYIRQQGGTTTSSTGPSNGRSGSSDYYIYAEASGRSEGDEASIETPSLEYDGNNICIQFYYHMYGSDMGRLTVYRSSRGSNNPLVEIENDQGNSWKQQSIDAQINSGEKIVFLSTMGDGTRSDIALDDISITAGDCNDGESLPWTCGFSNSDLCEMNQLDDNDFDYIRQRGSTTTSSTGPSNGRSGSSDYYIYAEASGRSEGDEASIETPSLDYDGNNICIQFYYHMYGSDMGRLTVYRSSQGSNNPLVEIENDQGNSWKQQSIEARIDSGEKIVFLSTIGDGTRSDIALDDISITAGGCSDGESLPWTCGFSNSDLCEMNQLDDNDFDYIRQRGSTTTSNTGPSNGRSGSSDYYIYAEASGRSEGDEASIETPSLDYDDNNICIQFYYHMYGSDMGRLTVYRSSQGSNNPLVEIENDQGNSWKQRSIDAQINSGERIVFLSTMGDGTRSDIALDDISITAGGCDIGESLPWSCSFSNSDLCEMTQLEEDDFDYIRQQGSTTTSSTGPSNGRTGSSSDYYIYAEASGRDEGQDAIIETPALGYNGRVCVQFYHHMYGSDMGRLVVYRSSQGINRPLVEIENDQGNSWKQRSVSTEINSGEKILFASVMGDGTRSDIALDDINISTGDCGDSEDESLPWTCSFSSSDLCNMVQDTGDDFNFVRQNGGTSTSSTGPSNGRTGSSSDYYVYAEGSSPQVPDDEAIIETPSFDQEGGSCIEFYYHMYGNDMGKLIVYRSSRSRNEPLVTIEGDQGNSWLKRSIETNIHRGESIFFLAEIGDDIRSDIALDDISVKNGDCEDDGNDFKQLPWTCGFDSSNLCVMTQDDDDDFNYVRQRGGTTTGGTGPSNGRGGSSDYYIYAEASGREEGHDARIDTPGLDHDGDICLQFYYHMYGSDMGKLTVYRSSQGSNNPIVEIERDQGNSWQIRNIQTNIDRGEKIVFMSEIGDGTRSDIAIDDIQITEGDCLEQDIEELPWTCSFSSSTICDMIQDDDDDFDYTRQQGSTSTSGTGPSNGRTGSSSDYYMYAEASGRSDGQDARVRTPPIGYNGDVCLKFYYHMYGNQMGELVVYRSSRGAGEPLVRIQNDQGNSWQSRSIEANIDNGESIVFMSEIGEGSRSDIALDDIEITAGDCENDDGEDLPWSCSFSSNLCSMSQRENDDFDWTRQRGATDTSNTGPGNGRTGQSSDYYIYTEASSTSEGDVAIIETPALNYRGSICVEFYYHMYGTNIGRLVAYRSTRDANDPLFELENNQDNSWQRGSFDASINSGEKIVFMGEMEDGIRGDIALDDIDITTGDCDDNSGETPQPPEEAGRILAVYTCSTEDDGDGDDDCRMRQDSADDFQWTQISGRTPSGQHNRRINGQRYPTTGPSSAREGDYYLYIEASGRRSGDMARLEFQGRDFESNGDNCLRFWYCMNGHHTGELRVYTVVNGDRRYPWSMEGDQLQNWHRAAVYLDMDDVDEIGLEATVNGEYSGDIAVDDIRMTSGRCQDIPDPYIWLCDFEFDDDSSTFCNMEQDERDTTGFDWTLQNGGTPSRFTGPDRAYNGDFYIYIEASQPRREGDDAIIFIPPLGRSGEMCVEFRYSMYGHHAGELEVFTRRGNSDTGTKWNLSGDQGQGWDNAEVTIDNLRSDERIGFRGVRGTEYSGDIALDNIRVKTGEC